MTDEAPTMIPWETAVELVRYSRADNQCECWGQCDQPKCFGGRCVERHQVRSFQSGHKNQPAWLNVIARDGDRNNRDGSNLLALCQWCRQ